jgi:hypothetical protein
MLNGRSSSSRPGDREEQEHLNQLLFGPAVFVPQELPTQDAPLSIHSLSAIDVSPMCASSSLDRAACGGSGFPG